MKTDMSSGHFSASDRYRYIRELAFEVAFCVLFLQALFVVAFTRRFTISMLKLSRIKSKITVGRYKYVFAVVAVLLVVAVACGFVGSLGTLATPLHLAEQGIFASVAVFTTTAGFVFARGFRAATSSTGAPSPVATQSPLTLPPGRSKALPAPPRAAAQPPGGAQAAAPASDAAGAVTRAASAPDAASDGVGGDGRWANPIVRLSRSFRMSFRSSRSIFSSASGSGSGSGSPTQAGQGQSVRARRGSRMAAQMQGAVFVGIAGAVGMGAALAWSVATGLPTPQEWLSFTALFRALELVLASSALYTVASARNRLARPVCPYHLLDFALCGADCLPADSQVGAVGGGIDDAELLDGSDRKRAPSGIALSESDGAGSSSDECDSESDGSDSDSARGTRLPRMPRVSVLSWTAEKS
ncbi:hypothetical protein FNF28_07652 [Cafeteria roenbergensis]|uniref:Uncharacterized protein n=1 Tax=Cafeteria roenbergensis TaxID=33653 RepID=A0A5A8C3A8_CAFRO|nr:hypothetical protein FNF28_07652 [Cafeteria roenbergensis]